MRVAGPALLLMGFGTAGIATVLLLWNPALLGLLFAMLLATAALVGWLAVAQRMLSWKAMTSTLRLPGTLPIIVMFVSVTFAGLLHELHVRTSEEMVSSPLNFVNVMRVVLLGVVGLWALTFYGFGRAKAPAWRQLIGRPQVFYLAYAAIAVASSLYASYFLASIAKSSEILVAAFVMGALYCQPYRVVITPYEYACRMWNLLLALIAILLILLLSGGVVAPGEAFEKIPGALFSLRLVGSWLFVHPNTSGQLAAIILIVSLNRWLRSPRGPISYFWIGLMLLGVVVLFLAQSRTSWITAAVAAPLVLLMNRRVLTALAIAILALVAGSTMAPLLLDLVVRGQNEATFTSGTGRLDIWEAAWGLFMNAPIQGNGFYTGVRIDLNPQFSWMEVSNVDNTFLEVLVGVGIVGFIPFVLYVASVFMRAKRNLGVAAFRRTEIEITAVFVILLGRMILGSVIQAYGINLLIVMVIGLFCQAAMRRDPAVCRDRRNAAASSPRRAGNGVGHVRLPRLGRVEP